MTNRNLLPSKKFLKTLGGIILLILIIILIGSIANKKTLYKQNLTGKVVVVDDVLDVDTDKDGLKDWEENLWGTDPQRPDSDNDGISDADEIRKIQEFLIDTGKDNPDAPQNDKTKTGALTRDIMTIAAAISQSGPVTKESSDAITTEIANYLEKRNSAQYTVKDIIITENATEKQKIAYLTLIKKSAERTPLSQADVTLIENYEVNMDSGNMLPYTTTADKFKKELDIVKKIPAPEQYITAHLLYINALEGLQSFYRDLALQDEDPARALGAFLSAESVFDGYQKVLELMQN